MSRSPDNQTTDPFSGLQILSEGAFQSLGSMEAVAWEVPPVEKILLREIAPGILLAALLTGLAIGLQRLLPESVPLGAAVLAMVLGIAVRNALRVHNRIGTGCRWIVTHLIPVAIVLIGAGLDLSVLMSEGLRFLGYILTAVLLSAFASVLLGRLFGVPKCTALLIGAGTGICGSSAILAVAPVIEAEEDDILLSVGAINLIGLVAMFACIGLTSFVPFPAIDFGILTGATIHAVPTVAAAAFDHSPEAGHTATLVKMGRIAMLVPLVIVIAALRSRKNANANGTGRSAGGILHFVPWFVWGFAAAAAMGTLGLVPDLQFPAGLLFADAIALPGIALLASAGKLLLTLAMAAIGLQVGLHSMLRVSGRSVLMATALWLVVAAVVGVALAID